MTQCGISLREASEEDNAEEVGLLCREDAHHLV